MTIDGGAPRDPALGNVQGVNPESPEFVHGCSAIEQLIIAQGHQFTASVASNNYLKNAHASPFNDWASHYLREEAVALRDKRFAMDMARYHVATAMGYEAFDPSDEDSGAVFALKDPAESGTFSAAFIGFTGRYDKPDAGLKLRHIREGAEQLAFRVNFLEIFGAELSEVINPAYELSEDKQAVLDEWLASGWRKDPDEVEKTDQIFETDMSESQLQIQKGALLLVAAQSAISITNMRETYDFLIHGSAEKPIKSEEQLAKLKPEARMRERLRRLSSTQLAQFADACIAKATPYIPILREAGILPNDYESSETNPAVIVAHYRLHFGVPSDEVRESHKKILKKAIVSPKVGFVLKTRSPEKPIYEQGTLPL
ncbi:MAG: hypothetical protein ACHQT9_04880 [Candidatus Saccharimonadales bacterium]